MAGANSKYNDDFPGFAEEFARQGLNDAEIADKLNISLASYYNYQRDHLEFLEAIKRGKAPIDNKVENALLKRALGFEFEEVTVESKDGLETSRKITTKYYPPDVGAVAFWLKNRKPDVWRDKKEVDLKDERKDITKLFETMDEAIDKNEV